MDEEQFILRLPPTLSSRMRLALSSNRRREKEAAKRGGGGGGGGDGGDEPTTPGGGGGGDKRQFAIRFTSEREAIFTLDDDEYPAELLDLPAIVETHKTADKRTFFKSGDVRHVLVVRLPNTPGPFDEDPPGGHPPPLPDGVGDTEEAAAARHEAAHALRVTAADGLTPAAAGARDRFDVPPGPYGPDQVATAERLIKFALDRKIMFHRSEGTPATPAGGSALDGGTTASGMAGGSSRTGGLGGGGAGGDASAAAGGADTDSAARRGGTGGGGGPADAGGGADAVDGDFMVEEEDASVPGGSAELADAPGAGRNDAATNGGDGGGVVPLTPGGASGEDAADGGAAAVATPGGEAEPEEEDDDFAAMLAASMMEEMGPPVTEGGAAAPGGAAGPEAAAAALHEVQELNWRETATKVCVFIADAPPHGLGERGDGFPDGCPLGHDPIVTARNLAQKGVTVYSIGVEPVLSSNYKFARDFFMMLASMTGGKFLPLGKASILADVIVSTSIEGMELEQLWASLEAQVEEDAKAKGETLSAEELCLRVERAMEARAPEVLTEQIDVTNPYMDSRYDMHNCAAFGAATSLSSARANLNHAANEHVALESAEYAWGAQCAVSAQRNIAPEQMQRAAGRGRKAKGLW